MDEELEKIIERLGIKQVIKDAAFYCSDRSDDCDDDETANAWADVAEDLDSIDCEDL